MPTPVHAYLQSEELQGVHDSKLNSTVMQETRKTLAAVNNSLTVLRIREARRAVQQQQGSMALIG